MSKVVLSSRVMPQWCEDVLRCCECVAGDLIEEPAQYRCSSCDALYPISNRVPLFLPRSAVVDVAEHIARAAGGLDPSDVANALASAVRYRLHDPVLRGEFSQIAERYASFFPEQTGQTAGMSGQPVTVAQYFANSFAPGQSAYRSFRIRNETDKVFISHGERPFNLSYILRDEAGSVIGEGPRSFFPIPLAPGRELTVPVLIQAPHVEGRYKIDIMVVQEFVSWYDQAPLFSGEMIVSNEQEFRGSVEFTAHEGYFDFAKDLGYCGEMLSDAVNLLRSDMSPSDRGRKIRVLELACGSDPQTLRHYQPGTQVIALDLCYPQSQIGALQYAKSGAVPIEDFLFVAGDVFDAPIREGSFDIVVISAALHHFSDLVAALQKMASFIHRDGRIILLREPGKVCADDATFIAELAAGFNEQQFELEEYQVMYNRAALKVDRHKVDFDCSYKAVLKRLN